jgi:hypothetical protein
LQRLAEHYRKLAAEEVAMAKVALTNEARARHYAKAANYWKLADAAAIRLRVKPSTRLYGALIRDSTFR